MFNPAKAAEEIKNEFIGYITTSFHFRNPELQNKLTLALKSEVSKGPFVEIKDSFKSGKSIAQLIEDKVLSPLFEKLGSDRLPVSRPLYLHQQEAVEKIVAGKNVVVSTGTGSGKTHCFMLPVINELLREKEAGTLGDGVRAIFIYPMNALANDQIKGLREILMNYPDIRFGVYNGGTENRESDAIALYKAMYANEKHPKLREPLLNEELSREGMKKHPPHILFTNYAMLEHMLFRPGDDVLFSDSNFKFVVLDEAHVYAGATGIETSFLLGRLKGRINGVQEPQFILTSATLGDGSARSNQRVAEFAERLTGCRFSAGDIITAHRDNSQKVSNIVKYPIQLFEDWAGESLWRDVLKKFNIEVNSADENSVLYDIISSSHLYQKMRDKGNLVELDDFAQYLGLTKLQTVQFVSLCAKARKSGKPLIDIRYHYFLKALDGCYLALDYPESLSLVRKDEFRVSYQQSVKMFEIAVCEDCGELAIIGKIENDKLVRTSSPNERMFYQVEIEAFQNDTETNDTSWVLCKNCGAIVRDDESHNNWCRCGNTQPVRVYQREKEKCLNCNGDLRPFYLGFDAATGVIATSLYEQIPEHTFIEEGGETDTINPFLQEIQRKKQKKVTGSQFLVFSDSRQGAAKFACYLSDSHKEFLRRRGMWKVLQQQEQKGKTELNVSDFVTLLDNYYSTLRLFRKDNSDSARDTENSSAESRRNAWVAVLNELISGHRDTSLVSLGRMSFEYIGNNDIIDKMIQMYKISKSDARNLLNYLVFEIVRIGAVVPDEYSDIGPSDRQYLFRTSVQTLITKNKDNETYASRGFLPTRMSGKTTFYRSNRLAITKRTLGLNDEDAVAFLENYWGYLVGNANVHKLLTSEGKGYVMPAKHFKIKILGNALLWKCKKCGKVSQFNIGGKCIHQRCNGELERLNSDEFCRDNHFAGLYDSEKMSPLFVKEHTAQLAKKDALEYQQQFIRKEINALSCSTTFEMGVDVGDLETVFLRNIPPLASNYAQRVGRAGRSIEAAAFALTYARLSSHDFTFFEQPREMINGVIYPPNFTLDNEKILRRHIYAIALSTYLKLYPEQYDGNKATMFINGKGYVNFLEWLRAEPVELSTLIKKSITGINKELRLRYVDSYEWLEDFCGEKGSLSKITMEFEQNIQFLEKEYKAAMKQNDLDTAKAFERKLERYQKNDLIDFLVRGNILPKYGFPVDSVELSQNIASKSQKSLNLSRDLSVAIAEYAPSSEIVADGGLYTSRYIRKPIVNKSEMRDFDTAYIAICQGCDHINYSKMPIGPNGTRCVVCEKELKSRDFSESIEPRAGFIAEEMVNQVPLSSQERKYKTEAIYIGDPSAYPINKYTFQVGNITLDIESTANDSLVVKSTDFFYVCPNCGYSIASDEEGKLRGYDDYRVGVGRIERTKDKHNNPFGRGKCSNTSLKKYCLHHEFKTDVAKISFSCDTSDHATMLSVMYALLNSFAYKLNIERRDIKACLKYKKTNGIMKHQIIIYDGVPGGAGHSRRLVTEDGDVLRDVIKYAVESLERCQCEPSCYRCLRSYENQKIHEKLNRDKALQFLKKFEVS
jgi:ATP-dependent helicase YprA (DUF1998 family)